MRIKYFSLLFVTGIAATAQNTVSIKGTTVDSATGKPIAKAVVIATNTAASKTRGFAWSGTDGSFQIPPLPSGTYNLCAQVPQGGYLPTCKWGIAATTVSAAAAQNSTGNTVKLKASSTLKIHLDDAGQLLSKKGSDGRYPDLFMGAWSAGTFYPAHTVNKSSVAADYQLDIPFDTNLNFSIQSYKLALSDSSGKPLPSNIDQQGFQHSSAETNHVSFSYKVLSAKQ